MTRIYEIDKDQFDRIDEGEQRFIILKNNASPIKTGDVLILQYLPKEKNEGVRETTFIVDFFLTEGLKSGYVACALKEPLLN